MVRLLSTEKKFFDIFFRENIPYGSCCYKAAVDHGDMVEIKRDGAERVVDDKDRLSAALHFF